MIADSSFLISFLIPEDENHAKAVQTRNAIEGQTIIIPDRVIEETVNVLAYKRGMTFAIENYENLNKTRQALIRMTSEEEWRDVLGLMKSGLKKMSFTDHLLVYLASMLTEKVLTFDRQLLRELKKH